MMGDTYVKIFFIRVGRNKNWDAIVTTDTHMKFVSKRLHVCVNP